jgi:hypothetical protein
MKKNKKKDPTEDEDYKRFSAGCDYEMDKVFIACVEAILDTKCKPEDYPTWLCWPCGELYGNRQCGVATWHTGICGICGSRVSVTEPRDFGHLKDDSWKKHCDAIDNVMDRLWNSDDNAFNCFLDVVCWAAWMEVKGINGHSTKPKNGFLFSAGLFEKGLEQYGLEGVFKDEIERVVKELHLFMQETYSDIDVFYITILQAAVKKILCSLSRSSQTTLLKHMSAMAEEHKETNEPIQ